MPQLSSSLQELREIVAHKAGVPFGEISRIKPFLSIDCDLRTKEGLCIALGAISSDDRFPLSDSGQLPGYFPGMSKEDLALISPSVQTVKKIHDYLQSLPGKQHDWLTMMSKSSVARSSINPHDWVGQPEQENQKDLRKMRKTLEQEAACIQGVLEILRADLKNAKGKKPKQNKVYSLPGRRKSA